MANKPDFSELAKKLDISQILGGIKSLIAAEAETPQADPSDAMGTKMAQLSMLMQQLAKISEQQTKEFAKASQLMNELYKDLERLRGETKTTQDSKQTEEAPTQPPQDDHKSE